MNIIEFIFSLALFSSQNRDDIRKIEKIRVPLQSDEKDLVNSLNCMFHWGNRFTVYSFLTANYVLLKTWLLNSTIFRIRNKYVVLTDTTDV